MASKHFLIYLFARGIPAAITFLSLLLFTRMISPDAYGKYALVMAIINLGNIIFFQWLRAGVLRFMPNNDEDSIDFGSTVGLGFVGIIVVTLFIAPIYKIFFDGNIILLIIALVNLWAFAWFELNQTLYRKLLQPVKYGLISLYKAILSIFFGILFLRFGWGVEGLLVGVFVGTLLSSLGVTFTFWRKIRINRLKKDQLIQIFKYGFPLTLTFSMVYIIQFSDRLLIGWLKNVETAGYYAVATDLANQSISMIMMIINLGALPIAIKKFDTEGEESAKEQLNINYLLMLSISLPIVVIGLLFSSNIAYVLFEGDYRNNIEKLLPYILVGSFFLGLKSYYFDQSFQIGNNTKLQIIPVSAGALFSIIGNILLIPKFGVNGAAVSFIGAAIISMLLSFHFGRKVFSLPVNIKESLKIISSSIVVYLILYSFSYYRGIIPLVLLGFISVLLFIIIYWILNVGNIRRLFNKKRFLMKNLKKQFD